MKAKDGDRTLSFLERFVRKEKKKVKCFFGSAAVH